jgi:negative regulator of replication initiation
LILTYATHFDRVKYPLKLSDASNEIVSSAADILRDSTTLEVSNNCINTHQARLVVMALDSVKSNPVKTNPVKSHVVKSRPLFNPTAYVSSRAVFPLS